MYTQLIQYFKHRPQLYAPSTAPFWDDPHISMMMLDAHLAPNIEAASRKHDFIDRSAGWIAARFCTPGAAVLDLGCGPGLYTERFCKAGFTVTGVDLSQRSIDYAVKSAAEKGLSIDYRCQNYLTLDEENAYDLVTLIYCDFGVLSPADRAELLRRIYRALKPGGRLLLDGHTRAEHSEERRSVNYNKTGFWSVMPHLCIESNFLYTDTRNVLDQYVVITSDACQCYNIWNQLYTPESLVAELSSAGFTAPEVYDDVAGAPLAGAGDTVCAVVAR